MAKKVNRNSEGYTHDQLQSKCVKWFSDTYPLERGMLFQVKNNSMGAIRGAIDKSLGTVRGASDTILILDGKIVGIEFKVGVDRQSRFQRKWEADIRQRGHDYWIVTTLEEFKIFIHGALGAPRFRSR